MSLKLNDHTHTKDSQYQLHEHVYELTRVRMKQLLQNQRGKTPEDPLLLSLPMTYPQRDQVL